MKNGFQGEDLRFSELVNINEVRELCESFTAITGFVTAILDLEGNILTATGWQDLCTRFHRVNITTASRCRESDTILAGQLRRGESYNVYKCTNGLVDVAVPIKIGGKHIANFFTGQFFFEPPDKEYFIKQAEEFGFDKTDYLAALSRVPVFSENQVVMMMNFFSRLALLIGEMGLAGKSLKETNVELYNQLDQFEVQKKNLEEKTLALQGAMKELEKERCKARESEQYLLNIIDFSPDATLAIDDKKKVIIWNRAIEEMTGIPARDMIGKGDYAYTVPFYGTARPQLMDLFWEPENEIAAKYPVLRKEGDSLVIEVFCPALYNGKGAFVWAKASPFRDPGGHLIGAIECIRDITDRKEAEDSIRRSEANYRRVIENIQDVFYRSNARGDLIMASPSFLTLLGYESIDECIGNPIAETFYYNPEKRTEFLEQIKKNGSVTAYEVVLKRRDGTPVIVETSSHFYYDDAGNFAGIEGVFRDITIRRQAEEALQDAFVKRKEMEFIINHSPAVVWLWKATAGWPVEYVSDNLCNFGYTPDDFTSSRITYTSIIHPDDLPGVADEVEKYTNEGKTDFTQEYRILTKSGEIRWIDDRTWVRRGADGSVTHYQGIIVDITERKRAEEALHLSEQHMKAIVDGSPIPQFVINREHCIIHWNRALEEYSGIKSEDVIGTNQQWRAFYNQERPCMADLLVDGLIDKITQWYSGKYSHSRLIKDAFEATDFFPAMKDGTWLYFTAAPLHDKDGVIIGAVETLADITAQKRAEDALRFNAERSETLLKINQMADAPLQEIMKYAFEEAIRLTQSEIGYLGLMNDDETVMEVQVWSRNVMVECSVDDKSLHFPVESAGLWAESIRQRRPVITNDYNAPNPWKKGCPEGHVTIRRHMNIPVIVGTKIVLVAGVGNKTGEYNESDVQQLALLMEGMWRLIERKQAGEDRKKLEDQLIQAQKMESVGRLAGGVAHDFNNMLTPIMGYAELLKRSMSLDDSRQTKLNEIIRASERSRDLVRQLLAFARKQNLEMKPVDLNRLIAGFENMLRRTLHENIKLEIYPATSLGLIMADIGQIEQIILNLAVNAQDAMQEGGSLFIATSMTELDDLYIMDHCEVTAGCYIIMEITDTGKGIDPGTRERIFEPFFTTKGMEGTGLGLATVYGIVKQHGGHISVYSEPGKGTTFKVYFPRYSGTAVPDETERELDTPLQGRETLLVVEDQEQVRTMTVNVLKDYGYQVLETIDVKTAIETAATHQGDIHLLITDVILPDGNGRELYESLRAEHTCIKVLYMSGYTRNVISHHGVLEPGVQFIQKPFSLSCFMKKVREVLDES